MHLEQQLLKLTQQQEEVQQMAEMQAEENKSLKQHVATYHTENQSLTNLVKVLEQDLEKLDDLETELAQTKELYKKEKDLNEQLLNSAQGGDDDTGDEGDESSAPAQGLKVIKSGQMDSIFRQKYESE